MSTSKPDSFGPLVHLTELRCCLPVKRTDPSASVLTSEVSTGSPRRTDIHFLSFLTSYPQREKPAFTPQLISGTLITWSALQKAMNGKPPFGPAMAPLNGLSCLSG